MMLLKQMEKKQRIFFYIAAVYLIVQFVSCVLCYMINYKDNILEVAIRMIFFAVIQLFTPYITVLVACLRSGLVWNLVWETVGLVVDLICIPVFYFLVTMSSSLMGTIDFLYVLTFLCILSFPIVILVKIIMDVVVSVRKKVKK